MSLGDLTKQLVIDSLRPGETPAVSADNLAALILAQVQAMQNSLKDEQELLVTCSTAKDDMRVMEIYAPSSRVFVLTGTDADGALTRLIAPADAVILLCKPTTVRAGGKPARIRFIMPKPASA